jgi:ketosteroid isomerase-like protein
MMGFLNARLPMTKWMFCLILPALILSAAPADSQAEKEIASVMEAYKQAWMKKDAPALTRILSDDLTYTHSSNLHQDKTAVLASLNGKSITEAMDFKDLKIRVYGNSAVVTADIDSRANNAGVVSATHLHVLHVLVKGPKGWQMVARQATRYPEPASAGKK